MKIGLSININKNEDYHHKSTQSQSPVAQLETHTEKRNDEKLAVALLIVGNGLVSYHLSLFLAELRTKCYC